MTYRIEWKPSAVREFKKLPPEIQQTVRELVVRLAEEPRPVGCRKLAGFENAYRIRLGRFRVVYEIVDDRLLVFVIRVRRRSDSYRGL